MHLDLVTIVVPDHDDAVEFFRDVLGSEVAEDRPTASARSSSGSGGAR
ncbi:catechol 2,3-dioxygenase-like lactoylglutathione lyase family enzyme [Nocardioides luteus]|nr:VOC family protein [Nocardioides luteus]MDR7309502.1 catechol 2,3-dioxygenase-like lactoylglutathione lyase family enzyme [Nocardioides luteus]